MTTLIEYLNDFRSLAFPESCRACGTALQKQEAILCSYCLHRLPYTGFHLDEANPAAKAFWGRVPIQNAASFLYFRKAEKVQRLLHQLKYRGQTAIGHYLGACYGTVLKDAPGFFSTDLICPLPLHPERLKKRGYNQSEFFALGLGKSMDKPVDTRLLSRTKDTKSQTAKSRYQRFLNVQQVFHLHEPQRLRGRHVLLVDDLLTTGATLSACAAELLKIEACSVSVATIAYAP